MSDFYQYGTGPWLCSGCGERVATLTEAEAHRCDPAQTERWFSLSVARTQ